MFQLIDVRVQKGSRETSGAFWKYEASFRIWIAKPQNGNCKFAIDQIGNCLSQARGSVEVAWSPSFSSKKVESRIPSRAELLAFLLRLFTYITSFFDVVVFNTCNSVGGPTSAPIWSSLDTIPTSLSLRKLRLSTPQGSTYQCYTTHQNCSTDYPVLFSQGMDPQPNRDVNGRGVRPVSAPIRGRPQLSCTPCKRRK